MSAHWPVNRPSAAFLKNSSVDKVRDSIVEFNSRLRQSLKRHAGKKIRTAQKACEASKVESASDPRSPGFAACPARICSSVPPEIIGRKYPNYVKRLCI